jgi:hypothetical protein
LYFTGYYSVGVKALSMIDDSNEYTDLLQDIPTLLNRICHKNLRLYAFCIDGNLSYPLIAYYVRSHARELDCGA